MSVWNPALYLVNASSRLKPALDLLSNVAQTSVQHKIQVRKVLDLGCGPGNITSYLSNVSNNINIII